MVIFLEKVSPDIGRPRGHSVFGDADWSISERPRGHQPISGQEGHAVRGPRGQGATRPEGHVVTEPHGQVDPTEGQLLGSDRS